LHETAAWIALVNPPTRLAIPEIVQGFLPRATGLGVMLGPNVDVQMADLARLAPDPLITQPPVHAGLVPRNGLSPYVLFDGPARRALEPGVYAVSVSWRDAGGLHAGTWHVELRPGPIHR